MKLSKRSILMLVCLMTAATLTVAGTIAFLTDTAEVTNTFTVGKVALKLDETVVTPDGKPPVDEEGKPVLDPNTQQPARTEDGNNYHLIPGMSYTKDPMTTVMADSESSYVRMKVTITNYTALDAAFTAHEKTFDPTEWVEGEDTAKWVPVGNGPYMPDTDGNLVLEYRYFETVSTKATAEAAAANLELPALFTSFTVPGFLTGDDMATLATLEIQVRAEAIQAASFADAEEAWTAFDDQVTE